MIARKRPTEPEEPDDESKPDDESGAPLPGQPVTEGELLPPAATVKNRADLRLLHRAIRSRWPTNKRVRRKVVDTLERIISNPEDPKMAVSACKVLVQADAVNVAITKMETEAETSEIIADRPKVVIYMPSNGRDVLPKLEGGN